MNTLTYKGITWDIVRAHGKVAFTHRNISVVYEPRANYCARDHQGVLLTTASHVSECLERVTDMILETYAEQFSPMWT